jgi:hypothetical protein
VLRRCFPSDIGGRDSAGLQNDWIAIVTSCTHEGAGNDH